MKDDSMISARKALLQAEVDRDGLAVVSRRAGKPDRQIKDMLTPRKTFGDRIARELEPVLRPDLPRGWLVYPDPVEGHTPPPQSQSQSQNQGIEEVPKMAVTTDEQKQVLGQKVYTGEGVSSEQSAPSETEDEDAMRVYRLRMVPVVGEVKGGDGGFFEELQYPVGHASEWIPTPIKDASAYALRVRGDSMHPRYRAGEFVIVMPSVEAKLHEDVVVRFKDGRKMIKVLNWLSADEAQFLSINNGYAPMTISREEILSIQAVYGSIPASALQSS